jgi:hypothetical protein
MTSHLLDLRNKADIRTFSVRVHLGIDLQEAIAKKSQNKGKDVKYEFADRFREGLLCLSQKWPM